MIRTLAMTLSLGLLASSAGFAQSSPLIEAKVEVLEELADEGVVDALYELARLATRPESAPYFDAEAGDRYLALSAASGRASAVRWLAYRLLLEYEAGDEAAALLSASALMGDTQSMLDLRLWPLIGPIREDRITAGFAVALERLAAGALLDCGRLPFECPPNLADVTALDPSTILRAIAWKNEQRSDPLEAIIARLERGERPYEPFPESRYRRFLAEQREDNQRILEGLAPGSAESTASMDWERRTYLDRQRMRDDTAREFLTASRQAVAGRYLETLQAGLRTINQHRDADRPISAADLDLNLSEAQR